MMRGKGRFVTVVLLGFFPLAIPPSARATNTKEFLEGTRIEVPMGASSAAVGDFNSDGKLDMAVGVAPDSLAVLLGKGNGTFQAPVNYSPGGANVAVGDFNGDGKLDLVALANGVNMLLGNGDGTFQTAITTPLPGVSAAYFAVGDFNGDNKLDLAIDNSGKLLILLGNGDGTFRLTKSSPSVDGTYFVAVGDFNHDGNLDLAVVGNSLSVLLGNGDGTFQTPVSYNQPGNSLAVGDMNGDGNLDLVVSFVACGVSTCGGTAVLLGNGDGTFKPPIKSGPKVEGASFVVVGDFNNDGKLDLAAIRGGSSSGWSVDNAVAVLLGNGDGTFGATFDYLAGREPFSLTVGDFNGDGHLDFVVIDANLTEEGKPPALPTVSVALGNDDGTFRAARMFQVQTSPFGVVAGDFNHDGKMDLAVSSEDLSGVFASGLSILLGNGKGGFWREINYPTNGRYVAEGDFNHDGNLDLAVGAVSLGVSVLLGNGDGTFQNPVNFPTGASSFTLTVGDFNGDGNLDIATTDNVAQTVSVLLGNGDGTFQPSIDSSLQGGASYIKAGDFNGDGKLDLALDVGAVMLGNGDGTFQPPLPVAPFFVPNNFVVGDFNRDGKLDLAFGFGLEGGREGVAMFLGNGDGTFQKEVDYGGLAFPPIALAAGDFNGDGKLDVAAANFDAGVYPSSNVSVYFGNGDGTLQPPANYALGAGPSGLGAVDLNGDGALDLVGLTYPFFVDILLNTGGTLDTTKSSLNPSKLGQPVTFTTSPVPTIRHLLGAPTGTVTFSDGTAVLGTAAVTGGRATLTTSSLSRGTHQINAVYSGDKNYNPSTAPPLTQTVQ